MKTKLHRQRGLSLLEVCMVIATVALIGLFFLPMMARPHHGGSRRISCVNNLKQVGLAYRLWANDYGDQYPFGSTNAKSSLAFVNSPQVFRHYEIMSNELNTPKILVCPSDTKRTRANDFVNFSNTNVSYFVGLDAIETDPQRLLSGDRNITGGTLSNGFMRIRAPASKAGWTEDIHVNAGNVGLADGSVQQMTSRGLQNQLQMQSLPVIRLAIP